MEKLGKHKCDCEFCTRNRTFTKHLNNITDESTKEWFSDFYNYVCELEENLVCYKIYNRNVKTLYPRIWKETTTVQKLEKNDAEFPEKQI